MNSKDAKVYIEKTENGYQLIRNGSPFYIKGASGRDYFQELKNAGGNTIRIYDTTNLGLYLDKADSLGLAVVADISIPRYFEPDTVYQDGKKVAEIERIVKNFVQKHKDHPALLYWILGNELKFPDLPGDTNFYKSFNNLLDLVHTIDPNHPVSTAVGGFDRSRILSLQNKSKTLDLISINIFGELNTFQRRKKNITLFWDGPYVFTEFGVNGPWEAEETSWMAPIEQTSTKKAEHFRTRYIDFIKTIDDGRFLGSLGFYWGHKQERTHTWFSTFSIEGTKTQVAFEMENIWKDRNIKFEGPEIDYLLLNNDGATANIILSPNQRGKAKLLLPNDARAGSYITTWEIRPENWNYGFDEVETTPEKIKGLFLNTGPTFSTFKAPEKEGPYRLFVRMDSEDGYFATANIPFYVMNKEDGQ